MSKRIFTREQIEELSKNENVAKCSEKSITYSKAFKVDAIRLYAQGMASSEIFRQAGFNLSLIGRETPKGSLVRWNRIYRLKGANELNTEARGRGGGRPKIQDTNETDKIKRLETEIAYLKAENSFLAKLRASKKR